MVEFVVDFSYFLIEMVKFFIDFGKFLIETGCRTSLLDFVEVQHF